MKLSCFLIGFLLCTITVFPQSESNKNGQEIEKQYDHFKKTFNKEFSEQEYDINKDSSKYYASYLPPVELPYWFFDYDDFAKPGHPVVFGISDPGLDSTLAIEQASMRALGLLSIFNGATIQNITDVYSNESGFNKIVGKFSSFSKIESSIDYNLSDLKIFKQGYTSNGEAVILAGIDKSGINTRDIKGLVGADYFLSEEGDYNDLYVYSTYNFNLQLRPNYASDFGCHNTRKSILIVSSHNNEKLDFEYGRFKYFLPQEIAIADEELLNFSYTDLSGGLWNAYLSGILRQVEMADKQTSEIKRMGDQYAGKFQTLTREISNLQLSFELTGIFIKNNILYLKVASQ